MVLQVGDAWLVGVGKRAPHGFRCPCLVSPHGSLDGLKACTLFSRTTRPSFYALESKNEKRAREISSLTGSSPHMRNSIAQGRFGPILQRQPLPWDDSTAKGNRNQQKKSPNKHGIHYLIIWRQGEPPWDHQPCERIQFHFNFVILQCSLTLPPIIQFKYWVR